jgi:3-oxocholest-4-en-26-oyl-CoA dehydrogenase alpha subunit
MDYRFTAEEEAFRADVRAFIRTELPRSDEADPFSRKLARRGWLTMSWPREYGGQEAPVMRQLIYNEEMALHGAAGQTMGVDRVGPTLMLYGSTAQKNVLLPRIAADVMRWCQGFSEPGAGSDLAALQTRALEDGDSFVVNGQKIWTSGAQHADFMILLVRTDPDAPKHRGISYFLLDMKTPGVVVQPLVQMTGEAHFNQVFFDNVRVPRSAMVGEQNRGWYVAAATLDFERSGIQRVIGGLRIYEQLVRYVAEPQPDGRRLIDDARIRTGLADLKIGFEVGRMLAYRVAWMQAQKRVPNYEASMSKLLGTELQQRLARFAINTLGLSGQLQPAAPSVPLAGRIPHYYLSTVSLTIAAGTSEINRNIIAQRGLGLPRG